MLMPLLLLLLPLQVPLLLVSKAQLKGCDLTVPTCL